MTLIGMFEARCFRLQAAEGGVGVGGTVLGVARRAAGVCRLRLRHGQAATLTRWFILVLNFGSKRNVGP